MRRHATGKSARAVGIARLTDVLAEPTRLRILLLLSDGPQNVRGLAKTLRVPQPLMTYHLLAMQRIGLIRKRRVGPRVLCSLNGEKVGDELRLNSQHYSVTITSDLLKHY